MCVRVCVGVCVFVIKMLSLSEFKLGSNTDRRRDILRSQTPLNQQKLNFFIHFRKKLSCFGLKYFFIHSKDYQSTLIPGAALFTERLKREKVVIELHVLLPQMKHFKVQQT